MLGLTVLRCTVDDSPLNPAELKALDDFVMSGDCYRASRMPYFDALRLFYGAIGRTTAKGVQNEGLGFQTVFRFEPGDD